MTHTYRSALDLVGVPVPDHLSADAQVPVLTGSQAQGDLLVLPVQAAGRGDWQSLTAAGLQVVRGEATGNTHWLHPGFDSPDVRWRPGPGHADPSSTELVLLRLLVPDGQSALLIHTDEHGANGIGPGEYELRRKRQLDAVTFRSNVVMD